MILEKTGYSYNDLTIVPVCISQISSRSECNPFINDNMLPIFASPMSTITNKRNIDIWKQNKITPIIPRNLSFDYRVDSMERGEWVALSLSEFKDLFIESAIKYRNRQEIKTYKVCVDLANGHMRSLYDTINIAKNLSREYNYNLVIMTGNIANPETYYWICQYAEVDYIRLSIGTGNNCITSTQTSVHYPIATLIEECYNYKRSIQGNKDCGFYTYNFTNDNDVEEDDIRLKLKSKPEIVADGGIRGYADVIKAIALGADYVMIGSVLTGLLESAAPLNIECYNSHYKYSFSGEGTVNNGVDNILNIWSNIDETDKRNFIHDMKEITKESYGMSTKKAQRLINPNAKTKTSEGCTKNIKVKETVKQWTENMIDYLKSAMSYTNCHTLKDFRGNVNLIPNSNCAVIAVNK